MKTISELLKSFLNVQEAFEMPAALLKILQCKEKREALFDNCIDELKDLSVDWFTSFFQEVAADRKELKQDFTPDYICEIVSQIAGNQNTFADICSGTGGLTIKLWNNNKKSFFHCEEYSNAVLPFLLFNLAIRNIEGEVFHGDALTREAKGLYKLAQGEKYSTIIQVDKLDDRLFDAVVENPPYSQKWTPPKDDPRFSYGLAPKSKADMAFVLHGLSILKPSGTLQAILPHGVLFRNDEKTIRENLTKDNKLYALISFPSNSFQNTGIPTLDLVLKNNSLNTFIIDSQKNCTKVTKFNILTSEQIDKVLTAYKKREDIELFARLVNREEIERNDYNLNIPRYVSTELHEEPEDIGRLAAEWIEIQAEELELKKMLLNDYLTNLEVTDKESKKTQNELELLKEAVSFNDIDFTTPSKVESPIIQFYDIERAKKGKKYKFGDIALQVSATRGQCYLITEQQEVESKFVVFQEKNNLSYLNCIYLYILFLANIPIILKDCQHDMNINVDELKKIKLNCHDNQQIRNSIASRYILLSSLDDR